MKSKLKRTIAIAGNPNVGKSTIFNGLTGLHQHTGNWPGKTVENARGYFHTKEYSYELVDLPGTYSLNAMSEEESIAGDYICNGRPDGIIVVCDASCLERNLILAQQILKYTSQVLLCVNFADEAKRNRMEIHTSFLSQALSVPVIITDARKKESVRLICDSLDCLMEKSDEKTCGLKSDEVIISKMEEDMQDEDISSLVHLSQKLAVQAVTCHKEDCQKLDRKIDSIVTSRLLGFPLMFLFLFLIFWLTITAANYPSALLSRGFSFLELHLSMLLQSLHAPEVIHDALVFGIFRVLSWVISVMLPPMAIFFPLFSILEDSGYLPRIAYNLDKPFHKCKACGKQALTMCMGFGCNAVGVTGCRIIDSKRERLIAILTNSFVPCNGRFPTLIALLTMFFVPLFGSFGGSAPAALGISFLIVLGICITFLCSRFLSATILKGVPSSFTLELPPYRRPQFAKVLVRSLFDRTLCVLGRAVLIAAPAGLVIWLFGNITINEFTLLQHICKALDPAARLMGMDGVILFSFILGFPANEIVIPLILMAYLSEKSLLEMENLASLKAVLLAHGWTLKTALCTLLFTLFHWPCSTTLLTIRKETGSWYYTMLGFLIPTVVGFLLCAAMNLFFR